LPTELKTPDIFGGGDCRVSMAMHYAVWHNMDRLKYYVYINTAGQYSTCGGSTDPNFTTPL